MNFSAGTAKMSNLTDGLFATFKSGAPGVLPNVGDPQTTANTADIATNTANIATNTGNIATNTNAIANLSTSLVLNGDLDGSPSSAQVLGWGQGLGKFTMVGGAILTTPSPAVFHTQAMPAGLWYHVARIGLYRQGDATVNAYWEGHFYTLAGVGASGYQQTVVYSSAGWGGLHNLTVGTSGANFTLASGDSTFITEAQGYLQSVAVFTP